MPTTSRRNTDLKAESYTKGRALKFFFRGGVYVYFSLPLYSHFGAARPYLSGLHLASEKLEKVSCVHIIDLHTGTVDIFVANSSRWFTSGIAPLINSIAADRGSGVVAGGRRHFQTFRWESSHIFLSTV